MSAYQDDVCNSMLLFEICVALLQVMLHRLGILVRLLALEKSRKTLNPRTTQKAPKIIKKQRRENKSPGEINKEHVSWKIAKITQPRSRLQPAATLPQLMPKWTYIPLPGPSYWPYQLNRLKSTKIGNPDSERHISNFSSI